MIVLGQWSCALVGYGGTFISTDWGWRMPILTQLVPPVSMFILGFFFLPESPSWLLMHGRREAAVASMQKFRGPETDADAVITEMEVAIAKEKALNDEGSSYLECFQGTNLRRTTIVVLVYLAQQFIGSGFITSYLPYVSSVPTKTTVSDIPCLV
jgi:MFS family permease